MSIINSVSNGCHNCKCEDVNTGSCDYDVWDCMGKRSPTHCSLCEDGYELNDNGECVCKDDTVDCNGMMQFNTTHKGISTTVGPSGSNLIIEYVMSILKWVKHFFTGIIGW